MPHQYTPPTHHATHINPPTHHATHINPPTHHPWGNEMFVPEWAGENTPSDDDPDGDNGLSETPSLLPPGLTTPKREFSVEEMGLVAESWVGLLAEGGGTGLAAEGVAGLEAVGGAGLVMVDGIGLTVPEELWTGEGDKDTGTSDSTTPVGQRMGLHENHCGVSAHIICRETILG